MSPTNPFPNLAPWLAHPRGPTLTHDPRTNVAYVTLVDRLESGGSHHTTYALGERAIFDFDAEGRILGLEVLEARELLRPETLEHARRPRAAEDLLDPLDRLVLAACLGDLDAVALLERTYREPLVREAEGALGPSHRQDAQDVVQDFWIRVMEGSVRVPIIRGAAMTWMRRTVRSIALEHLRKGGGR